MPLSNWRVLVVEDESDTMELVQDVLEHHGITVMPAPTAEHALDLLQQAIPTLILIDLALPGMDGWELLAQLQHDARLDQVQRVAFTAYHSPEVANKAIEAGFDAYFPKPIDATSFVRELQSIVDGSI